MASTSLTRTSSGTTSETHQAIEDDALLREKARETLRHNNVGDFTKPSATQYPHQWNWDSALVALGFSHFDQDLARNEVRGLLKGQWRDGMVPHVIYHNGASDYFPNPEFWQTDRSDEAATVQTSGITQPPLLATCVRLMHARADDKDESQSFVREVYPKLLAWHRWLHLARDPHMSGLAAIIHPWESGNDNAARWIEPMVRVVPTDVPHYERLDMVHVDADERPAHAEYERFIHLIDCFRSWRYDPHTIYEESPFLVEDTLFNALLYRADKDLRALAVELGEPTIELDAWLAKTEARFNERFWNDEQGLYYAYDARNDRPVPENSVASFVPLFAGLASEAQARRLVEEHMLNPEEYAPEEGERHYLLPSLAKNHLFYEPRRYWRGPVWIITNWMVAEGLEHYGYPDLATKLRDDSLDLVRTSGFVEYYDPRDGSGAGTTDFSWSAALTLELLSGATSQLD